MNKRLKAFSLIEAMIILVLISVGIMALVPLISQKTTGSFWSTVTEGGKVFLIFGEKVNQHLGLGIKDNNILRQGKTVADNIAIGYDSNDTNKAINIGSDYNSTDDDYSKIRTNSDTIGRIRIGQNNCKNADKSITIAGFKKPISTDDCPNSPNQNYIQIGDHNNGFWVKENTSNTDTRIKIIGQDIIVLKNKDFSFNLPAANSSGDPLANPTKLFEYNELAQSGIAANTLKFYQNLETKDEIQFTNWKPGDVPDAADVSDHQCLKANGIGNAFIKRINESRCQWFCEKGGAIYNGSGTGIGNGKELCIPSDKRLKNIKGAYTKGLNEIQKLETFMFTFKDDKNKRIHAGIIAQKLKGIFDEALHTDSKGYYSYEKEPVLYAMINSVKEINSIQNNLLKEQKKSNRQADRLLRKYSK